MEQLKYRIMQNIVKNMRDQFNDSTFYYSWSVHDLDGQISSKIRV